MSTKALVTLVVTLMSLFMVGTVVIALMQDDIEWGWWWAVPIGGVFVLAIIGFRVLVQRSAEAAERLDRELDASGR
ncbi:hypothetical protein [Tessaracoccus antarcticus]|uniref:Uncharacterized protein n=1 Tax=Tessaracoccus antarcticus TaxID=2479848 RepID=A0A3M0G086_9ACTN|nr:hypothetical protein [Tessaracoccus antarcticus]RMB58165.1 hypothetical protein EAX62_13185 [Tessaracoccus antarcticus]